MKKLLMLSVIAFLLNSPAVSASDLVMADFQPDQEIDGFLVKNLYENGSGEVMGARFISKDHGFLIDLMRIQSVPQAFYWIKTPPVSDMGEPHACEHLLLGKGNRGRYVAAQEQMALSNSSAYTSQLRTCYHFNTIAGDQTFYEIFEAKLQALVNPDFNDEEILREICHLGVNQDAEGKLSVEEKGTVFTEMVSSYEKYWYHLYKPMAAMMYGEDHPLVLSSGGNPEVMKNMTAQNMWDFIAKYYTLPNMGVIVSIPNEIDLDTFLQKMAGILDRVEKAKGMVPNPGIDTFELPEPNMAPEGKAVLTGYPSDNPEDPGYVIYNWPPGMMLSADEQALMEIFLAAFSQGESSDLYNMFINSETRVLDLGCNYVSGGVDDDIGSAVYFSLNGVNKKHITEDMLEQIETLIIDKFAEIKNYEPGSTELAEFNERARNRMIQSKKQIDNYLNSPPMFGFRSGVGSGWLGILEDLEHQSGFKKSLVYQSQFNYIDSLLKLDKNIWNDFVVKWQLLDIKPYAVGAYPDPEYVTRQQEAKQERMAEYIDELENQYGTDDEQEAIAKYKADFDAKTVELNELASNTNLPGFINNPPMTLDDQIDYEIYKTQNGIEMVASTFDNMTASELGIAFNLYVVPEAKLMYVPLLPSILTDIGVTKDGKVIPYDEMSDRLREEILSLRAGFDHGFLTGRTELFLSGRGNDLDELKKAISWMDAALYAPYLSIDNLPRLIDLIDQSLISYRNYMKSSEENWVNYPSLAYRYQNNPLIMSTNCFLTEIHHYQRLKWQLTNPGDKKELLSITEFTKELASRFKKADRETVTALLSSFENLDNNSKKLEKVHKNYLELTEKSKATANQFLGQLQVTLNDIPDADLADDLNYLCDEFIADLGVAPADAISNIKDVLSLVKNSGNARMYMISNRADRKKTIPLIEKFVSKLDSKKQPVLYTYDDSKRIFDRLRDRVSFKDEPVYAGLIHEGTRNGVMLFSARKTEPYDTSTSAILDCLAGKLLSGSGSHGFFMRTWGAGLAYSNGYSFNPGNGRVGYYAERCPDISETMKFVVDVVKNTEVDESYLDYTLSLIFASSRAPSRYEARGREIATDLVDGITPERVSRYRQKVLDVIHQDHVFDKIKQRMETSYGPVFAGYGPSMKESDQKAFFIIGPETQFESWENYIAGTPDDAPVYRLYPRDFWLTM